VITLDDALRLFATHAGLDANQLIAYAKEDGIGGFHPDIDLQSWYMGSVWEVEGKFLYAIVRALKPHSMIEIGTWRGCSATHILLAMEKNGLGQLTSVDVDPEAGAEVPQSLRHRWTFVNMDGTEYLAQARPKAEIVWEDTDHTFETTTAILAAAKRYVQGTRVVLSHDACHPGVGSIIRRAWDLVFKEYSTVLIDPSDCGFAFKVL
jgi:predicted O-methyltransferase YrrM